MDRNPNYKTRVLLALNAMKGSLSSVEFARALSEGLQKSGIINIESLPLADGGDGSAAVLAEIHKASFVKCKAYDPLMRKIDSGFYLTQNRIAIVEMADASGLRLLDPREYNPLKASSYGTGQLVQKAIDMGAREIWLCVGGTATVDAGMGALMALDTEFYSSEEQLNRGNGEVLGHIRTFDFQKAKKKLAKVSLKIICDVKNPLLGNEGAASIFAPQKGADENMVQQLDENLAHWARLLHYKTGVDVAQLSSGGAAGGIVATCKALFNAEIIDGAKFILEKSGFYKLARQADCIITGEGSVDESTLYGKLPGAVLEFGTIIERPVLAVCGFNALKQNSLFAGILSLAKNKNEIEEAMKNTYDKMVDLGEKAGHEIINGQQLKTADEYFEEGKTTEALTLVDEILEANNENQEALWLRVRILYKMQKWGEALNSTNRILELNPGNTIAKNYREMINNIVKYWNKDLYNP